METQQSDVVEADLNFPIVGIGASAGGLAAFEDFFSGIPAETDPGMAFVLVQHLAPDHKSLLVELVGRFTKMPVYEIEDGMHLRPNCVYIAPANHEVACLNGVLLLSEPLEPHGRRLSIDAFFCSLAQDQNHRSIGVILSGTGSDGTLGVRAIKSQSGRVLAQDPKSTAFSGMPESAIATGCVDDVLLPSQMPSRLMAYLAQTFVKVPQLTTSISPKFESSLNKILLLLRSQTGHDFSQYKVSTVLRRIERRMALNHVESIEDYVKLLKQIPTEAETLFRALLIGVTNFFRDPEAFDVLERTVIPDLIPADAPAGKVIRIWVSGCSTGEEAYSLAILLHERTEAVQTDCRIQIFATDIDPRAIAIARTGVFPATVVGDISPARLSRYFSLEPDSNAYRIKKSIREMIVFSEQDAIRDPPFSKLDLISCRNLMIYFGAELQRKLIPLFHFALRPEGYLFLGTSEGIGGSSDLFVVRDRKAKIYQSKENFRGEQRPQSKRPTLPSHDRLDSLSINVRKLSIPLHLSMREFTEQAVLKQLDLVAALVNAPGDILYLHGRSGNYLEPCSGQTGVNNILKMARNGLRHELTVALHKAVMTQQSVRVQGVRVESIAHLVEVDLLIGPVSMALENYSAEEILYIVVFIPQPVSSTPIGVSQHDETGTTIAVDPSQVVGPPSPSVQVLMNELRARDEYLQCAQEELESSNEELRSSNEEMQSVNEELQSTNEELETSKEEMQSINEELATVNAELQVKISDLSRLNNDMNNLLAGSGVATVFVDQKLCLLRFTPAVAHLINLIPGDVGRPVGHIVSNLVGYDGLVTDAQSVLDTLVSIEKQVQAANGSYYTMRIRPYRTLENVIEGVVITFVDITDFKRTASELEKANQLLRLAVVQHAVDAMIVQDLVGRILAWNPAAVRLYGWSEQEALQMSTRDQVPQDFREDMNSRIQLLCRTGFAEPYRSVRLTKAATQVDVWVSATALQNEEGEIYAIATIERKWTAPNLESKQ